MSSKWQQRGEQLVDLLQPVVTEAVPVTYFQKLDIVSHAEANLGQASGMSVIVTWLGGANPERRSASMRLGARYSVSLWVRADLVAEDVDYQGLAETMGEVLHGWQENSERHELSSSRLEVVSIEPVTHPKFYVLEIQAEISRL